MVVVDSGPDSGAKSPRIDKLPNRVGDFRVGSEIGGQPLVNRRPNIHAAEVTDRQRTVNGRPKTQANANRGHGVRIEQPNLNKSFEVAADALVDGFAHFVAHIKSANLITTHCETLGYSVSHSSESKDGDLIDLLKFHKNRPRLVTLNWLTRSLHPVKPLQLVAE
jgi:hypothetical protein